MKTQNFGCFSVDCDFELFTDSPSFYLLGDVHACPPMFTERVLKNYRENRENGNPVDNPKRPFPSSSLDELEIKSSNWQGSSKWPDPSGRYWWKLTLNNGQVINDFYWMKDEVRGWPDENNEERYWFTVHHANGTKIEGFSQEPDDKNEGYWRYIQFTDTHCPAIRQWMEEKDRNYQIRRISLLLRMLYQPPRVQDGFNLFPALPTELQLMILQFVAGRKLVPELLTPAINSVMQKKALSEPDLSKEAEKEKEEEISHLSQSNDVIEQRGLNLDYENIQLVEKLGEGAFGIVSYGQWRFEDVAVKQLHLQQMSENALMEFKQEAAIMACLRSDYIVTFKGFCLTPYALVMEYMHGGSLFNVLHSQAIIPWSIRHRIALDIAKGLAFLHSHQPEMIVHWNLKSQNVLLDAHQRAKLVDFGLAKVRAGSSQSDCYTESSDKNVGSIPCLRVPYFH